MKWNACLFIIGLLFLNACAKNADVAVMEGTSNSSTIPNPTSTVPNNQTQEINIQPVYYYRFESTTNLGIATIGNMNLSMSSTTSFAQKTSGPVGKYAEFKGGKLNGPATLPATGSGNKSIAIEFLFKPSADFNRFRQDRMFYIENVEVTMAPESWLFKTPNDSWTIDLKGIGPKSVGYYLDGNFHHFLFQYDGSTGTKEIFVDGFLIWQKTAPTVTALFSTTSLIESGHTVHYDMFRGYIDELAFYDKILPDEFIYQHFLDFQNGSAYTFLLTTPPIVPSAPNLTESYDSNEFAPGFNLPSNSINVAQGVTVSALDQLKHFPTPRLKLNTSLPRNPSHFSWDYLGNLQYENDNVANQVGADIYSEMADRWNYYLTARLDLCNSGYLGAANNHCYYIRQVANAHPEWPVWALTLRVQNGRYQRRQDLPAACYIKDANGVPLTHIVTYGGAVFNEKVIRPFSSSSEATAAGCPDSNYDQDATYVSNGFNTMLGASGFNSNVVFAGYSDNNEFLYPMPTATLSADPTIASDYALSGQSSYLKYQSNHFGRLDARFRNLVNASNARLSNAIFQSYQVGDDSGYYWEWTQFKQSFSSVQGYKLATVDFYPRWPHNWRDGWGPWHGLSYMMKNRRYQIDNGDAFYSPYTAAGYDADEDNNILSAQWLGLNKIIYGLGALYTFPGYYIESAPWPRAEAYIHQVATPIYAQAAISKVDSLFMNSQLIDGDLPMNSTDSQAIRKGYEFWSSDVRVKTIVRKQNGANRYLIFTTLQPMTNAQVADSEKSKMITITMNGSQYTFETRRQGSIYVLDERNSSNKIFYQLDQWHEFKHPYFWSQESIIEAETADSGITDSTPELKTEVITWGNFTNYTSFISFPNTQTTFGTGLKYIYRPTDTTNRFIFVKVRSRTAGVSTGFSLNVDNGTSSSISGLSSNNWSWVQVAVPAFNSVADHTITILPSNNQLEIDKIAISQTQPTN